MASNIEDTVVGDITRFGSKSPRDSNIFQGEVIAIGNHELAKQFGDIYTYNSNVVGAPAVDTLTFFIIKLVLLPEGPLDKPIVAFAKEWIQPETFDIIATQSKIEVTLFDVGAADVARVIATLHGATPPIKCAVTKVVG